MRGILMLFASIITNFLGGAQTPENIIEAHYENACKILEKHKIERYGMGFFGPSLITGVSYCFHCYTKKLEIQDARVLVVELYDSLLKSLFIPEKMRDKFSIFPLDDKMLVLSVGFGEYSELEAYRTPYVSMVGVGSGNISYKDWDENAKRLKTFHEESLEEARKIVKEQQPTPKYFEPSMFMVPEKKKGFFWKD